MALIGSLWSDIIKRKKTEQTLLACPKKAETLMRRGAGEQLSGLRRRSVTACQAVAYECWIGYVAYTHDTVMNECKTHTHFGATAV